MKLKLKKLFYRAVSPVRKAYWFIFHPKTYGVKVLIENNGKFLMIRNTYGRKRWTFPGGGKKRNETPESAAKREAKEEVGVILENLVYLGEYFNTRQYKRDTVYCFYGKRNDARYEIDNDEIEEAKWFALSEMPSFKSPAVQSVLRLYESMSHD